MAKHSTLHKGLPFKGIHILDVGCGGGLLTEVTIIFNINIIQLFIILNLNINNFRVWPGLGHK